MFSSFANLFPEIVTVREFVANYELDEFGNI